MTNNSLAAKEKQIGNKYASLLQAALRVAIKKEGTSFSTLALKTKVVSRVKDGYLQRIVLESPKHSFVNHYGFEGIRSNGRKLSLKPKDHLYGLKSIQILNGLADDISDLRGEQVIATINF